MVFLLFFLGKEFNVDILVFKLLKFQLHYTDGLEAAHTKLSAGQFFPFADNVGVEC